MSCEPRRADSYNQRPQSDRRQHAAKHPRPKAGEPLPAKVMGKARQGPVRIAQGSGGAVRLERRRYLFEAGLDRSRDGGRLSTHLSFATLPFGPGQGQRALPSRRKEEVGKRGAWLNLSSLLHGAASASRRCSCLPAGTRGLPALPQARPGLRASHPNGAPLRRPPGTAALPRYPVRTEFPVRAVGQVWGRCGWCGWNFSLRE
jgi:hypothetical protein